MKAATVLCTIQQQIWKINHSTSEYKIVEADIDFVENMEAKAENGMDIEETSANVVAAEKGRLSYLI